MASSHIKLLLTILSLTVSQSLCVNHTPCHFPAVFNFGDSNSDTGAHSAMFGPAPPPNGETFFKTPAGRYSDGRLIIDFIASSLNLPYLSAYLNSLGTNFSHGANFAAAGSTIRRQNTTIFQSGYSPISLDVQSWQFTQFKSRSSFLYKHGGIYKELMPNEKYFSKALYTFDIGQNDLTSGFFSNMTTDEVKATIPDITQKLKVAIQSVYGEGGRYFWIHNTGPFGCLPYVRDRVPILASEVDKFGCGVPFNDVAKLFNEELKDVVNRLRSELPLASFVYVDVYSVKYSLFSEARKHGFEHPLVTCCGHGGKYGNVGCGETVTVNGTRHLIGRSCKNPATRVVWDGVHYTEAANKFIFDRISGGGFSDPPLPISSACRA